MKRINGVGLCIFLAVVIFMAGCVAGPRSFMRVIEPGWSSIELRPGLEYETAWKEVLDVLAKQFEMK